MQFQPRPAPAPARVGLAPLLYVFVHHLVDGRPPGVPLPAGLSSGPGQGRLR